MKKKNEPTKKKKRRVTAAKALFAVLAAFAALFIVAKTVGGVALSGVSDALTAFALSVRDGGGYPYDISGQNVTQIGHIGSSPTLVGSGGVAVLDFSAAVLQDLNLKYSDPAVSTKNGRAVVFDRNTKQFCVIGRTKLLHEGESGGAILTAAMSKNGFVAVASLSDKAASVLTVYDRSMREYFKWECADDYIADVSFSPNGKNIAVIVLGAKEAEICSKLWVFKMGSADPLASFEYDATALADVEYTAKRQIVATGDNLRSVISRDLTRSDERFSGDTPSRFAFAENGRQALVLLPYGDESAPKLAVYAKDGSKSFEQSFDSKIIDVACGASYTAALTRDGVYIFDSVGKRTGLVDLGETAYGVETVGTGGAVYVLLGDRVEKYSPSGKAS